jgi:transcriptional regulator GlxA family with amidase domain
MAPKSIGFIAFDNFTALHFAGPCDVLAAAALEDGFGGQIPCYEVCTIGLTNAPVRSESGMVFLPEWTLETAPELDTLIVPGGTGWHDVGTAAAVSDWLRSRVNQTRRIASIGSGIYPLALVGLLDGRAVTTDWQIARDIAQRFPQLKIANPRPLVKDGSIYTATGLSAGLDLALAFVEEDYGLHFANAVRGQLLASRARPEVTERPTAEIKSQIPSADRLGNLVGWIIKNLHADLSVEALARRACMCPGHFTRAFKSIFGVTPTAFVENLRLNEAKRRLDVRGKTLRSVAASVGFANSETFRKAFKRRFGVIPSSYLNETGAARFTKNNSLRQQSAVA